MSERIDLYRLLGVDANASTEAIRQAYKRKALEWHPDKRRNEVAAEQMFKDIKKAYETLSDSVTKLAYDSKRDEEQNDDNKDDDIPGQDLIQLLHGKRISEMYEEKISKWINEYPQCQFEDNFSSELMKTTKIILETYEHERIVDCSRHICPVCDHYCNDLSQHFDAVHLVQNEHLKRICHSTSLDDLLASLAQEDWSWKSVELCASQCVRFWSDPHWSSFERIIQQLLTSIRIFHDFIASSQVHLGYKRAEQIVHAICEDQLILNKPDITGLTEKIEAEFCSYENANHVASTSYSVGQQICVVQHPDSGGILSQIMFSVQRSPPMNVKRSRCSFCSKTFRFFRRRYRCYMCGDNQCKNCLTWQTCRHLGYTDPVLICHQCSRQKSKLLMIAIAEHVERLLSNDVDKQHLLTYIHLLKHYDTSNSVVDQFCQRANDYYLSINKFDQVIRCYQIIGASDQSFFKLAETSCNHSKYSLAAICFNLISARFAYPESQWQQIGDNYLTKRNAVLALLCYEKANLKIEQLWLKSVYATQLSDDDKALFIFYATWKKQNSSQVNEWITWLVEQLKPANTASAAISTLQLVKFSAQQWAIILNDLCTPQRHFLVASTLCMLDQTLLTDLLLSQRCASNFLQLALQMLTREKLEDLDDSMRRAFSSLSIEQILFELAVIHVFHHPDWQKLRNHYISTGQFDQAVACAKAHWLLQKLSPSDFDWIKEGFEPNQSFLYLLESLIKEQVYIELAHSHAQKKNYEVALNYYLLTLQLLPRLATVDAILCSANNFLPSSEAFRCYIAVYKYIRRDTRCAAKVLEMILERFRSERKPIMPVIAAALLAFAKPSHHTLHFYVYLLDQLSEQYEKSFSLINSIHHSIQNLSASTQSLSQRVQNHNLVYREYVQTKIYNKIKPIVYGNIIDLAVCLRDVTSITVLKQIHQEFFGNRDMSSMPCPYRVTMYLIECTIDKLEHRHIDAAEKLSEALAVCPVDETVTAILTIISDPSFHQAILQDLLNSIQTLGSNPSLQFIPLPVPSSFAKENLLTISPNLRVIRKYERAILKRLSTNPVQAALSYIDMCQAVHDPTCIVSNWLLACLHLYNLLLEMSSIVGKEAEVYAYRNMISELVLQSFLMGRAYLPPHMQIYTFRLLLPILLQTADLFRSMLALRPAQTSDYAMGKKMILSEQDSQIIQQLLNATIHLTKVSPLIQLPTCLSFDLIYRELVGQRFLIRFLETMIQQDIEQSYLYEYYLFEGVWQGWIRDHDFNHRRRACMEAILDTKEWDMYDVQSLLDIPLIPRNDEGWFYHDCRSLVFFSTQQFVRVDGISFHKSTGQVQFYFQNASQSQNGQKGALFDSIDVKEVFQLGVSSAIFTLNQPSNEFHAYPFQEMLYAPDSLLNTQYLATLLHTDYLLKMITTGTEVCAKVPFKMRPIDETFFQRLPEDLQEKLKPLHKRDRSFAFGRAHRFWIEADDVIYERQETDSCTMFRVADVRLRVRKHLLIRTSEGKMIDDENENEEEQRSAESLFAKAFTEHYDEIGRYFPELLRLKELLKLSALYVFARGQHQLLSRKIDSSQLTTQLAAMKSIISEYPHANDASVNTHYNQVLLNNGVSSRNVPYLQENELKAKIRRQLEEVDRELVNKLTQNFCEEAHRTVTNDVNNLVKNWLDDSWYKDQALAQWIVDGINDYHHQLKRPIEQLGIRLANEEKETFTLKHNGNCNLVPAVFLNIHGTGSRVYGGVNLQLKLVEGNVPRNNLTNAYNASSVLSNQSSTTSGGQGSGSGSGSAGNGGNNNWPPRGGPTNNGGNGPNGDSNWQRFGAQQDTYSKTAYEAHRNAKDQNGVPRSAQPVRVELVADRNPEAIKNGNYRPMVRQYTYVNSQGQNIAIRYDTARSYASEGGRGAQGSHYNAGPAGEKLHQHHWIGQQSGDRNNK